MDQPNASLSLNDLEIIYTGLDRLLGIVNARRIHATQTSDLYEQRLAAVYGEDYRTVGAVHKRLGLLVTRLKDHDNAEKMGEAMNLQITEDGEKRAEAVIKRITDDLRLLDLLFAASENVKGSVASCRPHPDMSELRSGVIGIKVFFAQLASLHKNSAQR